MRGLASRRKYEVEQKKLEGSSQKESAAILSVNTIHTRSL